MGPVYREMIRDSMEPFIIYYINIRYYNSPGIIVLWVVYSVPGCHRMVGKPTAFILAATQIPTCQHWVPVNSNEQIAHGTLKQNFADTDHHSDLMIVLLTMIIILRMAGVPLQSHFGSYQK